jgi:hypothetical protein
VNYITIVGLQHKTATIIGSGGIQKAETVGEPKLWICDNIDLEDCRSTNDVKCDGGIMCLHMIIYTSAKDEGQEASDESCGIYQRSLADDIIVKTKNKGENK